MFNLDYWKEHIGLILWTGPLLRSCPLSQCGGSLNRSILGVVPLEETALRRPPLYERYQDYSHAVIWSLTCSRSSGAEHQRLCAVLTSDPPIHIDVKDDMTESFKNQVRAQAAADEIAAIRRDEEETIAAQLVTELLAVVDLAVAGTVVSFAKRSTGDHPQTYWYAAIKSANDQWFTTSRDPRTEGLSRDDFVVWLIGLGVGKEVEYQITPPTTQGES